MTHTLQIFASGVHGLGVLVCLVFEDITPLVLIVPLTDLYDLLNYFSVSSEDESELISVEE